MGKMPPLSQLVYMVSAHCLYTVTHSSGRILFWSSIETGISSFNGHKHSWLKNTPIITSISCVQGFYQPAIKWQLLPGHTLSMILSVCLIFASGTRHLGWLVSPVLPGAAQRWVQLSSLQLIWTVAHSNRSSERIQKIPTGHRKMSKSRIHVRGRNLWVSESIWNWS